MPFDQDDEDIPLPQSGLKKVSSTKSMFDNVPKKTNQKDLDNKVKGIQDQASKYKSSLSELAVQFSKTLADKTLPQNKTLFQKELEIELLKNMIHLAQEINSDSNEREGEGSLSWITLLLKTSFNQRDKINKLEFLMEQLDAKINNIMTSVDNLKKND